MARWTQADYDALVKARTLGATRVDYTDGQSIVYRSLADIDRLIREAEIDLGIGRRITRRFGSFSDGLY